MWRSTLGRRLTAAAVRTAIVTSSRNVNIKSDASSAAKIKVDDAPTSSAKSSTFTRLPDVHQHIASSTAAWKQSLFSSWQNGLVTALGGCVAIAGIVFLLWNPLKEDSVEQSTVMASQALGSVEVRNQAFKVSKEVVANVLQDKKSVELVVDVVSSLLSQETTRHSVTTFLGYVFSDEYTKTITRKFVVDIISDKELMEHLETLAFDLVDDLLKDPRIREKLAALLLEATSDALKEKRLHAVTGQAMRSAAYYALPFTAPD